MKNFFNVENIVGLVIAMCVIVLCIMISTNNYQQYIEDGDIGNIIAAACIDVVFGFSVVIGVILAILDRSK